MVGWSASGGSAAALLAAGMQASLQAAVACAMVCWRRWRWWDEHNDQLPSMAMQDGLTNISGVRALRRTCVAPASHLYSTHVSHRSPEPTPCPGVREAQALTRAMSIHTTSASRLKALERMSRIREMQVRCTPGPVAKHSATFLFEFTPVGDDAPLITASQTMVWVGGRERSLLGRILARPAPVPQLLHDSSQPSPLACQAGCDHISAVSAELDRLRALANQPDWSYEQDSPELRYADENPNQHISSSTYIRLAQEAKLRLGGAVATTPVSGVAMDIFREAVASESGDDYVVRAAERRSEGILPHVEWCLFTKARDDLDNAETLLTRVRLFLSSEKPPEKPAAVDEGGQTVADVAEQGSDTAKL